MSTAAVQAAGATLVIIQGNVVGNVVEIILNIFRAVAAGPRRLAAINDARTYDIERHGVVSIIVVPRRQLPDQGRGALIEHLGVNREHIIEFEEAAGFVALSREARSELIRSVEIATPRGVQGRRAIWSCPDLADRFDCLDQVGALVSNSMGDT